MNETILNPFSQDVCGTMTIHLELDLYAGGKIKSYRPNNTCSATDRFPGRSQCQLYRTRCVWSFNGFLISWRMNYVVVLSDF